MILCFDDIKLRRATRYLLEGLGRVVQLLQGANQRLEAPVQPTQHSQGKTSTTQSIKPTKLEA